MADRTTRAPSAGPRPVAGSCVARSWPYSLRSDWKKWTEPLRPFRSTPFDAPDPGRADTLPAALAPRAAEHLSRLKGDLRLGLPAVLTTAGQAALVAWVEQIDAERFAALSAMGPPELVVTRHRAGALTKAPLPPGEVLRIAVPPGADLAVLRAMAGTGPRIAPAEAVERAAAPGTRLDLAATALAGAAQVLPAALVVPLDDAGAAAAQVGLSAMEADEVLDLLQGSQSQTCVSSARVPMDAIEAGRVHVFRPGDGTVEHSAIEIGRPDLSRPVTVRLHSACFTGDVLGSLKCDCGPQLRAAMAGMAAAEGGFVLYLNQEGRGIGLANKMRAYALQEAGLDTVEANNWLGFDDDLRDFRVGALMLQRLGIARVRLMTNNPAKVRILAGHGIEVVERVPLEVGRTEQNARYLATKAAKSGHLLT